MAIVGAHVVGGVKGGPSKGTEIGAEAIQIFIGSPQMWRLPNLLEKDAHAFQLGVQERGLGQVFVHCIYLVNLASENPEVLQKSLVALRGQLELADRVGAA